MNRLRSYQVVALTIGIAAIAYCAPMFQSAANLNRIVGSALAADGFQRPLIRSLGFAFIAALLSVCAGFYVAVILSPSTRRSPIITLLLLLPLMGSVFAGLAVHLDMRYKIVYGLISDRHFFATWSLLLLTQLWQFVPLYLFLFAVHLNAVSVETGTFMSVSRASWGETVRDVYWPHCRNLAKLLILLAVGEGMREFVKPAMIIRASTGTGTEMVTGRLERYYATLSKANFEAATTGTLSRSLLVTLAAALLAILTIQIVEWLARGVNAALRGVQSNPEIRASGLVALLLAGAVPLIGMATLFDIRALGQLPWDKLISSVVLALSAVVLTMLFVMIFAIAARVGFVEWLAMFDARSLPLFICLLTVRLVPPIAIVLCGFDWLFRFDAMSASMAILAWIGAQMMITFPLLAGFAIFTHFAVRTEEIEFHEVSRASWLEIARDTFLRRFGREYLLITIFGLSIILAEDAINSIMAFAVPSIAHELSLRIGGRSGSYREAVTIATMAATPVMAAIGMMTFQARRARGAT
jgi:ABC-type sugar transport system permease subunit